MGLESQLEKEFFKLSEKVKEKKGEVVFCLREFQFGKVNDKCFAPPKTQNVSYYETGIISGELQKEKNPAPIEIINFPTLFIENRNENHLLMGEYSISVDRKFKGFFINKFHKNFQFEIKDLEEQLKQGQLSINSREFAEMFSFPEIFYPGSKESNLKDFRLVIGDKEAEDFMKEKEIGNYQELFNILKKPEYVKKMLDEHYSNERERIGRKLTITANEIANSFREIQSLETSVMNTHLTEDYDADSRKIKIWDKEDLVNKYYKLKKEISNQIENKLKKYLEKGDQIGPKMFNGLFQISGETIGFPEEVSFADYSNWVKNKFLPSINKTFEKIDNYLIRELEKNEKAVVH